MIKKSINKYYHTQESCATFIYVPFCRKFSSCGGPSQLNECWKWSKHCKHVCMQACMGKSLCTMVHLCMCTCAVLLIFASCAWQSPWPLTTVLEPTRAAGWRKDRPGGLKELGPLSMITLIKLALCNDWLATGFISRYYLWISASLISERRWCKESGGGVKAWLVVLVDRLTSLSYQMIPRDWNAAFLTFDLL